MRSDDEVLSLVLEHRARVTSGRASIASAGEDLMRALLASPAERDVFAEIGEGFAALAEDRGTPEPCGHTPPGVIGN